MACEVCHMALSLGVDSLLKKSLQRASFNNGLHLTRRPVPVFDIASSDLLLPS
jgi:hypothetical protein